MNEYLDRVEAQLAHLTEQGAHQHTRTRPVAPAPAPRTGRGGGSPPRRRRRPPRRRSSEALAFLAAFAVAAAVVAIVMANVHTGKPQRTSASAARSGQASSTAGQTTKAPSTKTQASAATPAALPTHLAPQSFTAISELTWWLLGAGSCPAAQQAPCGSIIQTSNGGSTFTAIHAPAAPLATGSSGTSGYSQIRFADAHNGYAYRPDLYSTHDGGTTWRPVDVGGTVTDLAITSSLVYATIEPKGGGSGKLMRSPVNRDNWSALSAAGVVSGGLWVQGSDVIVQSGQGTGIGGNVLVSHDSAQSFTTYPAPSPGLPCLFAAPTPPVVWARCATGMNSGVWRSADGGAHFTAVVSTGLSLPNSAAFAAASATTAVVGYQQLYRTTDDGATWSRTGPSGISQWAYLGFTDATHGVALGFVGQLAPANERLFYTTDGGQTYHRVRLP